MFNLVSNAKQLIKNRTTYRVGLLQAKAYRILKQETTLLLADKNISTVDWATLGLLLDNPEGLRLKEMANLLGVEAPFVTRIFAKLKKMTLAVEKSDPEDSRAKIIVLTPEGKKFTEVTESYLRTAMKPLLSGVSIQDLAAYLRVLEIMVNNNPKEPDSFFTK